MTSAISLQEVLARDPVIGKFVDRSLTPPSPFRGVGPIRLVVLGQDPTVKREGSRGAITTVLNLDRPGSLRRYLEQLCTALGLSLDADVYATNYANVFFRVPPASLKDPDILGVAKRHCLPHLLAELRPFSDVPILSLGEPLLRQIATGSAPCKVREYWGFDPRWKRGETRALAHLPAGQNTLTREVFPFPHQPSANKAFYSGRLARYLAYMRSECSS
jgi:uracil-DNA glycosylase